MKEIFCFVNFSKEERELLDAIDTHLATMSSKGQPVNIRQLYYYLIRANLINGKDMPFPLFYKFIKRGLYGGGIDWYRLVFEDASLLLDQYSSRELWIRAVGLKKWIKTKYAPVSLNVVHSSKLAWSPLDLYLGAHRAAGTVRLLGTHTINYVTDYFSQSDMMWEKFKQRFTRMTQIVVARNLFNITHADVKWEPAEFRSSTKQYSTMRRYATAALKDAKELVEEHVVFNYLGLHKNTKITKEAYNGKLNSLPVTTLSSMLYSLSK